MEKSNLSDDKFFIGIKGVTMKDSRLLKDSKALFVQADTDHNNNSSESSKPEFFDCKKFLGNPMGG